MVCSCFGMACHYHTWSVSLSIHLSVCHYPHLSVWNARIYPLPELKEYEVNERAHFGKSELVWRHWSEDVHMKVFSRRDNDRFLSFYLVWDFFFIRLFYINEAFFRCRCFLVNYENCNLIALNGNGYCTQQQRSEGFWREKFRSLIERGGSWLETVTWAVLHRLTARVAAQTLGRDQTGATATQHIHSLAGSWVDPGFLGSCSLLLSDKITACNKTRKIHPHKESFLLGPRTKPATSETGDQSAKVVTPSQYELGEARRAPSQLNCTTTHSYLDTFFLTFQPTAPVGCLRGPGR